jgi:probable rRNA maturation factor
MINVEIEDQSVNPELIFLVERAAQLTLEYLEISRSESLTILITTDQKIQELNNQFRGTDAPTDVLAFPAGYPEPESGAIYLGDVVISYPRASTNASMRGHTVEEEIQLLVIHGVLHLAGHDHSEPQEKAQMWAAQASVLTELGISKGLVEG